MGICLNCKLKLMYKVLAPSIMTPYKFLWTYGGSEHICVSGWISVKLRYDITKYSSIYIGMTQVILRCAHTFEIFTFHFQLICSSSGSIVLMQVGCVSQCGPVQRT